MISGRQFFAPDTAISILSDTVQIINILVSFEGYINKILAEKFDTFVIVYLDDMIIYIKILDQSQVEAVRLVLDFFWKYGLFINIKKCQFYKDKIRFLGYVVLAQRVKIEDE